MNPLRRRLLLAALAAALPAGTLAAPAGRVVVVGGGFGGASCARLLRTLAPQIAVTLVEPREHFYTGPGCNGAIAGISALGDVVQTPAALEALGVTWLREAAVEIDPVARRVRTRSGRRLDADRLVLAPGIEMRWDLIDGLNAENSAQMPHAWQGDAQVATLQRRLAALPDGATIAISAPANPYRCPPGPYERASLMAWHQAAKGRRSKLWVLDAKDDFTKRALFQLGWDTLYPGLIEWVPRAAGGDVVRVEVASNTLWLHNGERLRVDLASVVPPQRAATIARAADLTDESGWCPVHPEDFSSRRHAGVHVIGDAAAAQPMPKSAFSANSQGKQVALSIAAALTGRPVTAGKLANTCYSLVAPDYAISVGGLYGVVDGQLATLSDGSSPLSASRDFRALEARYAQDWYVQITHDTFG